MKKSAKLFSLICAIILVLSMSAQAFALGEEGETEGSQTGVLETEGVETEQEEAPEPEEIPEHEHVWGDWVVTSKATYFAEGSQTRECTAEDCDAIETEPIAKLVAYNKWLKIDGKQYYFNSKGVMVTGWQKIRSSNSSKATVKWCYFNKKGVFLKSVKKTTRNKWIKVDGTKYYFTKKCKPVAAGIPYYNYKYKTYVLVDISDQKTYLYKSGKLIMTAECVTGTKGKHDTPTGTFKIMGKYRNCRLVGPTWNRNVSYWIPFTKRGHGLHDSQWRQDSEYEGTTEYLNNGSHGCVNLRVNDIKLVYSTVKKGTRVIVRK